MNEAETKQILENIKDSIDCDCKENMEFRQALEKAINYIENSISKETIKEKIERFKDETVWGYNDWKYDERVFQAELNIIDKIKKELLEG